MFKLNLILWIMITSLSACTVGPDYKKPHDNLPKKYSMASSSTHIKNDRFWIESFNDPLLVKLIHQALDGKNLDIQQAYARIRQARADVKIAKADLFPQITMPGKISRDHLSKNSELLVSFPGGLVPLTYTDYKLGFDASWELDFFGRTRRNVEAYKARYEQAIDEQQQAELSTAAEIARVYTQYRMYQQREQIARHTIATYLETQRLVALQKQSGGASGVDLQRVESAVLSSKAQLPTLIAEEKAQLAALAILVGDYPETLFARIKKSAPVPRITKKRLSVGLPSDLLLRRPDIKIAERELAASNAELGVAIANQFPRFTLLGDLGSDTTLPKQFFNAASRYWHFGPHISAPIFQGGRLRNSVKAQAAQRDIALAQYKKSVLIALADVESSLIRYEKERDRQRELIASRNKLHSTLNLIMLQYKEGQTSLIDVLDVERQLDSLNDEVAQSYAQVTINLVSVYKALGGDWNCDTKKV